MRRTLIILVLLLFTLSIPGWTLSPKGEDVLKAVPVGAKIILPLMTFIPEMIADPDALFPGLAGIGIFTIPSSFLMYNIVTDNPAGTAFWRKVTVYTDGAAGIALAGSGLYMLFAGGNSTGGWNIIAGGMLILSSLPVFAAMGLDTIPYNLETTTYTDHPPCPKANR